MFILSLLFLNFGTQAQEQTSPFLDGISAYQAEEFEKAESIFRPLFEQHPNNPTILYNLGLVEYQLGNFGLALGLWRKARFIDNTFSKADQAISFTEEQLFPDKNEDPVYITVFNGLTSMPPYFWHLLCLITLVFGGWQAINYGIKRRLPLNLWPGWIFFHIPLFLISGFFSFYLTVSDLSLEATIIHKDLLTRANPSTESPGLSELEEGQIVTVEKQLGDWVRIRTSRGTLGWVPQKAILMFKGF